MRLSYVVVYFNNASFLIAGEHSIAWIYHNLLTHFTNGAQVGYFHFRVIINEAACFITS